MSKKDLKKAVAKATKDTIKEEKTIKVEDMEIVEPNKDDIPTMKFTPEQEFINSMKQGELPPEAEGRNQYIFHRQTGRKLISFKDIYQNRKEAFEVWAKTEDYALELFMKRTQWKKRMGDTPCPIPEDK